MDRMRHGLWTLLLGSALLWLAAEPTFYEADTLFAWREVMTQLSGVLAFGCMSAAMVLALRLRPVERLFGGLDKTYRLHKWLGIGALVFALTHWLWVKGPKWAVQLGWITRPPRGPRPEPSNAIEAAFRAVRGLAETMGEWAFYAAVPLLLIALLRRVPYHVFAKLHRMIPLLFLVFAFHALVLVKFSYWGTPLGALLALEIVAGVCAAAVSLAGRIGVARRILGRLEAVEPLPGAGALALTVAPQRWPGHAAGQFAFLTLDVREKAHPFTIASVWDERSPRLSFVVKALGDFTRSLPQRLRPGQEVRIEGPYGGFTFADEAPRQIWVSGGVGVTPFLAALQQKALRGSPSCPVDYFHSLSAPDEAVEAWLRALAEAAGVALHLVWPQRDGRLTGERIRAAVPQWREASLWFCGPEGFGEALLRDFSAQGFDVRRRFHRELFAFR